MFIWVIIKWTYCKACLFFIFNVPNALLKYNIYAATFIREFRICQHGDGKYWQGTGSFKIAFKGGKKKPGIGLVI